MAKGQMGMCERQRRKHKENLLGFCVSDINRVIDEWVKNKRDRLILKMWLCDGYKFREIAEHEEVDLTIGQVIKICYRHEMTIYKHLGIL